MTYTYEVIVTKSATGTETIIKRTDQNGGVLWIPEDPLNTDYQAYLASLNEVPA
jgi:hypothetical protein